MITNPENAFAPLATRPVSYTHLDVYKRQPLPTERGPAAKTTLTPGYADMVVFAAGPRSVGKGRPAQLTIQARNQGGVAAPGATLWVELPDGLTFVSANPPATVNGRTVTWTLGDLPAFSPSQTFVVTVRGQTHSGGLTSPYYIRVAADTTTSQRQYLSLIHI